MTNQPIDLIRELDGFPAELSEKVFRKVNEGIMITDEKSRILHVNPAFELVTGYPAEEVAGHTPKILQSGIHEKSFYEALWEEVKTSGEWSGEIWNRRKSGEIYPEWLTILTIRDDDGRICNYCGIFTDLTDRKIAEDELRKLALTDSLTGISNRYDFTQRMELLLKTSERHQFSHALFFLDLDRFKQINDTLGHDIGDQLLISVSRRIQRLLKNKDIIARLGGDEFVITLTNIRHPREAAHLSQAIIEALEEPFLIGGEELYISTSIGIALYPNDGKRLDVLLQQADKAMYFAKQNGRNQYSFYYDELNTASKRTVKLENELRRSIESKDFTMYYQPKIELKTGRIMGFESLVRWTNDKLGNVSPGEFIPFAEETGLIIPLSEVIIEQVCRDVIDFGLDRIQDGKVSINISSLHFRQHAFIAAIERILEQTNCRASAFELELTERTVMAHADETAEKLNQLRKLGFSISVDDFGTGYSSLSYLHRFPIDFLKIDASFVRQLTLAEDHVSIVDAIITMAHRLKIGVIAEGTETAEQIEILKELECDLAQGYYFARPMPADEIEPFLELWTIQHQERKRT